MLSMPVMYTYAHTVLQMEAMKDEAISKLKELGNSLLGHFGMSLDNFKVNQDEKGGGGYSISLTK
jgi:hypothetical protein